jgi:hypothetical protein
MNPLSSFGQRLGAFLFWAASTGSFLVGYLVYWEAGPIWGLIAGGSLLTIVVSLFATVTVIACTMEVQAEWLFRQQCERDHSHI